MTAGEMNLGWLLLGVLLTALGLYLARRRERRHLEAMRDRRDLPKSQPPGAKVLRRRSAPKTLEQRAAEFNRKTDAGRGVDPVSGARYMPPVYYRPVNPMVSSAGVEPSLITAVVHPTLGYTYGQDFIDRGK